MPEVAVGKGAARQVPSQIGGALPIPTNAPDQTKNQVVLHVEHPTKPYQEHRDPVLAERTHWWFWFGHPRHYQGLPLRRSGWPTIMLCYYQSLPAAELNTHTMIATTIFLILIVGLLGYAQYLRNTFKK